MLSIVLDVVSMAGSTSGRRKYTAVIYSDRARPGDQPVPLQPDPLLDGVPAGEACSYDGELRPGAAVALVVGDELHLSADQLDSPDASLLVSAADGSLRYVGRGLTTARIVPGHASRAGRPAGGRGQRVAA